MLTTGRANNPARLLMPNLYFIKRTLYILKRQYGVPLALYRRTMSETDLATGKKTVTKVKYPVKRAVLCSTPSVQRQFEYHLSYLAANKNFAYGALFDTQNITFLIDAQDLPRGFVPNLDDFAIYNHKRYNISKMELLDHRLAYYLSLKLLVGSEINEEIDVRVTSGLQLEGHANA